MTKQDALASVKEMASFMEFTAEKARYYIKIFSEHVLKGAEYVEFADGEVIHFNNMTDDQAIKIANGLMELEAKAGKGAVKQ